MSPAHFHKLCELLRDEALTAPEIATCMQQCISTVRTACRALHECGMLVTEKGETFAGRGRVAARYRVADRWVRQ